MIHQKHHVGSLTITVFFQHLVYSCHDQLSPSYYIQCNMADYRKMPQKQHAD